MIANAKPKPKRRSSKLSKAERRELSIQRIRRWDESPAGRARLSRIMKEMDDGKKTPLRELLVRLRRDDRK